jgi:hypothetical protein
MRSISIKGLIFAIVITLLLDTVSGIGLTIALGGTSTSEGMTDQQIIDAVAVLTHSTAYLAGSLVLGTLSTVVGGFIVARVAKKAPYQNAGIFAVFGMIFGLYFAADFPFWFNAIGFVLVMPASLLGGWLGIGKERSNVC